MLSSGRRTDLQGLSSGRRSSLLLDLLFSIRVNIENSSFKFTFRAFCRQFYPKRLTISRFVRRRETTICLCLYSKDVHRTKCQALIITRLTHSPYSTKIARIKDKRY